MQIIDSMDCAAQSICSLCSTSWITLLNPWIELYAVIQTEINGDILMHIVCMFNTVL